MLLYFLLISCLCPCFAETHGGIGASDNGNQASAFDSVGKAPASDVSQGELPSCHIVCGPNKERYILHYFCKAREGRILKNGTLLDTLPSCRTPGDIICGNFATGFTIRTPTFSKARAQYKSELLGGFSCRNE